MRVQLEALITQLVFEHALRSRVTASGSTKGQASSGQETRTPHNEASAFHGKLNNLITSDMSTACDIVDLSYPGLCFSLLQIWICF